MNSILPEDYSIPTTSKYMKFVDGENTFRILGPAIVGNEFWKTLPEGKRPVRRRMNEKILMSEIDVDPKTGKPERVNHFWALPVWNYRDKAVQVLEITQKTIQSSLSALFNNKKWGDPKDYDIVVIRQGQKLETEYSVTPEPKSVVDSHITQAYEDLNLNLDALFSNGDPFAPVNETAIAAEDVFLNDEEFMNDKESMAEDND